VTSGFRHNADEICALLGYNRSTLCYTLEERRSHCTELHKTELVGSKTPMTSLDIPRENAKIMKCKENIHQEKQME
jgi:hypothetical protein